MEGKMPNSDADAHAGGPPLKKARYQWQVKGQKRLKENDAPLKSSQETDAADLCDSIDGFRGLPAETVPVCPSDVAGLNENNMQVESFMKQAVTHGTKDCEEDLSSVSIRSNEVTHRCSVVGYNLSGCSVDISAIRPISKPQGISQEMVQDGHKQTVITSTESHMIVPLNKTIDNSCSSVITGCSSSSCLHMEQTCEGKTNKPVSSKIETFSNKSVLKTQDVSNCGSLGNSCYEILEPGTSTGSISVETHGNVNGPCDKAQDILALESSNTNFMDLIQTKVDIQARKLNLLNMVQTNSRQENLPEDNTATIPMKTHSASPHLSPITTSDVLSNNGSTAYSTDHVTASELPDTAGQDSPESNIDVSHPQEEEEETFLSRWQNQHTAKAIVDNAINKTLEEMGLTPDVSTSAWNRLFLEDEGISEAIRFRGLWLRENSLLSGRIHPLISQITGASEQVFEHTLDNAATQLLRPALRETAERNSSPDEGHTQAVDSDSLPQTVHSGLVSQKPHLDPTSEVVRLEQFEPSPANPEELDLIDSSDVCEQTACGSDDDGDGHVEDICSDDPSEPATSAADDVLQFALNAAITSRGLSIRSDQSL